MDLMLRSVYLRQQKVHLRHALEMIGVDGRYWISLSCRQIT